MERVVWFLLYLVFASVYAYSSYSSRAFMADLPIAKGYGGLYKFLTSWNLHLQTLYYYYALLATMYVLISKAERSILLTIRDYIFGALVFPIGMYVGVIFWAMYNFDREVIYPRSLDQYVPVVINHVWHTAVLVFPIIESLLVRHDKFPSRSKGYVGLFIFKLFYLIWVFYIGLYHNLWIYPFMRVMNNTQFTIFILVSIIIDAACFEVGYRLNRVKNPGNEGSTAEKVKGQ
ncbi:Androgen-induced gene 1 protein [Trichoplax sp. H2]|nr:Androgen-induced gene 1 protein [Trichoplax sp. H2]|eukprot:RDD38397.1 Androgen-induced gene 1 protein [Trichoplax sp. H2]